MKILICGDSYCVSDPSFPGLHWSEKLLNYTPNFEVVNLAFGGCSNALIAMQLMQGLRLQPDFVILSFTSDGRYEFDKDTTVIPKSINPEELASYQKARYTTNMYADINKDQLASLNQWIARGASDNLEKLKNYFYILCCLNALQISNIPFCFTLGGFEYKQDYQELIRSNYMKNGIIDHMDRELATNLWYHGQKASPWFHVDDDKIQTLFASECFSYISNCHAK